MIFVSIMSSMKLVLLSVLLLQLTSEVTGSNSNSNYDTSVFGMSMQRDWMYESGSINLNYEGCVWGYVNDRENMGCMEDESGDGVTYWYMMANCRRAQVAYSLYASSSASSTRCKNGNWKESVSKRIRNLFYFVHKFVFSHVSAMSQILHL
jgi:outer membrane receptor for Fe3+-dicitrate